MAFILKGEDPRPPAALIGKVRNTPLKQVYKAEFPFCELCKLEGLYNTALIETHHIIPGLGRTDERWNIIRLCQRHHQECTTHVNGRSAIEMNFLCFSYKFVKGDITQHRLEEMVLWNEVEKLIPEMQRVYNNAYGIKG